VKITTGVTGNLAVYNRNAEGIAYQIFPNSLSKGNSPGTAPTQVSAGQVIQIPGPMDGFALRAAPPAGRNEIFAVVVPKDVKIEDLTKQFEGMTEIPDFDGMLSKVADRVERNIEVVPRAPRAVGSRQFEIVP
jgi:hypothetical protein